MSAGPGDQAPARRAATIATGVGAVLIAAKVALAILTGSVALLAEATHAAADLLRTIVAASAVRAAGRPGGPTASVGLLEGGIVIAAGVVAAFAAFRSLGEDVDRPVLGLVGLVGCMTLARLTSLHVGAVARRTGSAPLAAEAAGLRVGERTALIAAAALALVVLVDLDAADAIAGFAIAAVVVRGGIDLMRAGRPGTGMPSADERETVVAVLGDGPEEVVGYGRIGVRVAAGVRRLDVAVAVAPRTGRDRLDEVRREVRDAIAVRLPGLRVVVHLRKPEDLSREAGDAVRRPRK